MMKKLLAVLLCAAPLAGCGFTPLYGENSLAAAPDGRFVVIVWESRSKTEPVLMAEILR